MSMSPRLLRPRLTGDPDALRYIAAVQAADGQALEPAVAKAINDFVVGCKADASGVTGKSNWDQIKASCILMGARTLSGALASLVGAAPTNVNFVSGDYNRKTGLLGNGSTKYLNSKRPSNSDPPDSFHASIYGSSWVTNKSYLGGDNGTTVLDSNLTHFFGSYFVGARNAFGADSSQAASLPSGAALLAVRRSSSSAVRLRANGVNYDFTTTLATPSSTEPYVFAFNSNGSPINRANINISFYSIGESLDLAMLDTRVSALYTAIGVAIP